MPNSLDNSDWAFNRRSVLIKVSPVFLANSAISPLIFPASLALIPNDLPNSTACEFALNPILTRVVINVTGSVSTLVKFKLSISTPNDLNLFINPVNPVLVALIAFSFISYASFSFAFNALAKSASFCWAICFAECWAFSRPSSSCFLLICSESLLFIPVCKLLVVFSASFVCLLASIISLDNPSLLVLISTLSLCNSCNLLVFSIWSPIPFAISSFNCLVSSLIAFKRESTFSSSCCKAIWRFILLIISSCLSCSKSKEPRIFWTKSFFWFSVFILLSKGRLAKAWAFADSLFKLTISAVFSLIRPSRSVSSFCASKTSLSSWSFSFSMRLSSSTTFFCFKALSIIFLL